MTRRLCIGAVSLADSKLWAPDYLVLFVIAMNFHHSLYGNGTTLILSQKVSIWIGGAFQNPAQLLL